MQKLVKRTAQAQRQAARRAAQQQERETADNRRRARQGLLQATAEVRQNLRDARRARREDWEMGPLAPKRDLGFNGYGVFAGAMRHDWTGSGLRPPRPELLALRCAWAGGPKQLNLAAGDRVLIMDGPDKGRVDRIGAVQADNGSVTLDTYHRAFQAGMFDDGSGQSQPMPISVASIRLVHPIRNPETGIVRDVVINQLKAVPPDMKSKHMSLDRWDHGNKWDRVVPGINVVIPWPEVKAPEYEATPSDTVRDHVDDRSFHYNLLSPPMPQQVIDELRNKFSRFRTRHEAWYLKQKEAEAAAKKKRLDDVKTMQTPLDEFHEKQRQLREARGEPQLTDEMLDKIGRIMAKNRVLDVGAAGVADVVAASSSPSAPGPQGGGDASPS